MMVFAPGFIVIVRDVSKRRENTIEVVSIFKAQVLLDNRKSCRTPVVMDGRCCHNALAEPESEFCRGILAPFRVFACQREGFLGFKREKSYPDNGQHNLSWNLLTFDDVHV